MGLGERIRNKIRQFDKECQGVISDYHKKKTEKIRRRRLKKPESITDEVQRGLVMHSSPFEVGRNVVEMRRRRRMLHEEKNKDDSD